MQKYSNICAVFVNSAVSPTKKAKSTAKIMQIIIPKKVPASNQDRAQSVLKCHILWKFRILLHMSAETVVVQHVLFFPPYLLGGTGKG